MPYANDLQQTCKVCGRPDKFNFDVPDDIWRAVVPLEYRTKVVCLCCFDDFASRKKVDYATSLHTLYFAGNRACLEFQATQAVSIREP